MQTTSPSRHRLKILNWLTPILLVFAVVLLSAVVARSVALATLQEALTQQVALPSSAANSTAPAASAVDMSQISIRTANRLGSPDAPITIVEFSDFQCPFCSTVEREAISQLRSKYVSSGKISIVYKHAAVLGDESIWAAQAAECAADQGQFWEYHDLLFGKQAGENQGAFTKEKLIGFASELKLGLTRFEPCLKNDETLTRVQADTQEAHAVGVRGTPTFLFNGQLLVGAQPLAAFEKMIAEVELK
ncbi:Disulfide bond formation protein D [Anaerolineae bacterium]|nr:Disulfide bond formation protein D [Anaerolineae bacterium]